jgi:hypothetical protein
LNVDGALDCGGLFEAGEAGSPSGSVEECGREGAQGATGCLAMTDRLDEHNGSGMRTADFYSYKSVVTERLCRGEA